MIHERGPRRPFQAVSVLSGSTELKTKTICLLATAALLCLAFAGSASAKTANCQNCGDSDMMSSQDAAITHLKLIAPDARFRDCTYPLAVSQAVLGGWGDGELPATVRFHNDCSRGHCRYNSGPWHINYAASLDCSTYSVEAHYGRQRVTMDLNVLYDTQPIIDGPLYGNSSCD